MSKNLKKYFYYIRYTDFNKIKKILIIIKIIINDKLDNKKNIDKIEYIKYSNNIYYMFFNKTQTIVCDYEYLNNINKYYQK